MEHDRKVNQRLLNTKYHDMDPRKKELILARQYEIGFTKDEVRMANGSLTSPQRIIKRPEEEFDEIWVYDAVLCGANDLSLYFKDDILVKKENKEHVCENVWQKIRAFF